MSDLGELLVLLHGAGGRTSTVRATVRTWRDPRRSREAFERAAGEGGAVLYSGGGGAPSEPPLLG